MVLVGLLYYPMARHVYGGDSDGATLLLQAQSMVHGNPLLHGWSFLLDSFWTVEVPGYVLGYLLIGLDPRLLFLVPAVFAAGTTLAGLGLAVQGRRGGPAWVAGVSVAVLFAIPGGAWALQFFRAGWHVGTVLFCLAAFGCLRAGRWGWSWCTGVLVLALGWVGDLQTAVIGVAPVLAAGMLAMLRTRRPGSGLPLLVAGLAAPVSAYSLRGAAALAGSYQIGQANPHANAAEVRANLHRLPRFLIRAFGGGGDPGQSFGAPGAARYLHLLAAAAVIAAVTVSAAGMLLAAVSGRNRARADAGGGADAQAAWRVDDLLILACAADLALFAWAALGPNAPYLRYLTPFVVFGSILTARAAARAAARVTNRAVWLTAAVAGAAALAVAGTGGAAILARPAPELAGSAVSGVLAEHNLHLGVGYYWVANISTVASHGRVVIRAVHADRRGRLIRREQLSAASWYGKPFQFLIYDWQAPFEHVGYASAVASFGVPSQRWRIGPYEVLQWPHPITVSG
jgi:hypothetical protein